MTCCCQSCVVYKPPGLTDLIGWGEGQHMSRPRPKVHLNWRSTRFLSFCKIIYCKPNTIRWNRESFTSFDTAQFLNSSFPWRAKFNPKLLVPMLTKNNNTVTIKILFSSYKEKELNLHKNNIPFNLQMWLLSINVLFYYSLLM